MNRMRTLGLLLLLVIYSATQASGVANVPDEFDNPEFVKILNNYFGCKTWEDGICTQCSQNYYFNDKGICCEVKPQCKVFNRAVGFCEGCYQGYNIVDGVCVQVDLANSQEKGCKLFQDNTCVECSKRWFYNDNGVCQKVSDLCRTWTQTGQCETCYRGYVVDNGACIQDPNAFVPSKDSLCKLWSERTCLECADKAYFDANGVCQGVSPHCNTYDAFDGMCMSCFKGYDLVDGKCVFSPKNNAKPSDLGCKLWNWDEYVCLECSSRWTFNAEGRCVPVSDNCREHNAAGACVGCYRGYDLKDGVCSFSESNNAKPTDLGCKLWNWDEQVCLECSARFAFNADGKCITVSDHCKEHAASGACTVCYKGYDLKDGVCVFSESNNAKPSDLGCKLWNWDEYVCLECSARWTFNSDGRCVPVSDNCREHNAAGACTGCYRGYDLKDGVCVFSESNNAKPTDLGCKLWNWDEYVCLECSARWTFNTEGKCVPVSDNCREHAASGACTVCYKGYDLKDGVCVFSESNNAKPTDLGCKLWNWDEQVCLECSARWAFNAEGRCVPVSDNCREHAASGACTVCYKGYDLKDGVCVFSESNNAKPTDLGCKLWNWDEYVCLECSARWAFNAEGRCVPVSDNCREHAASGACTVCYKGYDLKDGVCVFSESNNAKPTDLGCKLWNWDEQVCLECSARWAFNAEGRCVPVSDNCREHAASGACTVCYKGYDLKDGVCVFSESNNAKPTDLGCKLWNWDEYVCLECSARWTFNTEGKCVPVSDNCREHAASGACTVCYKGYDLKDGVCVFSESNNAKPTDLGCKLWNWDEQVCLECSARWAFNAEGRCVPVSDNCREHAASGACTVCYKGYDLKDGVCVFSESNNAKPTDLGCKLWNWDEYVCLECSARWTFNTEGKCVPVSDNCREHAASGACTVCYKGYDLKDGVCVFSESNNAKPTDLGCKLWNWDEYVCLECSARWTFNTEGKCVPVSDNCREHAASGACTVCYKGYDLKDGVCVFSESNNAKPTDLGCKLWNWDEQVCLECSARWAFNAEGRCVPVSDNCREHAASGACTVCYKGYDLKDGVCVFSESNNAKPTDLGCKLWNWDEYVCLECSARWTFNTEGKCVPVSDNCREHAASGACTVCYKGYDLKDGVCVFSESNNAKPTDLGCKLWNWDEYVCLECSARWTFNTEGKCVPVSDNCREHAASGACTVCYKGYDLKDGVCVFSESNNAKPTDLGCKLWNWDEQVCLECSARWAFNAEGRCVPVSDNCREHAASGACTVCYKGYDLKDGVCVFSESNNAKPTDLGCKLWNWDEQVCLQCSDRWTFNSESKCVPVSDYCSAHNASGACTSCFKGYNLVSGVCEVANSLCKSASSTGSCTSCYNGYVLYRGNCRSIQSLADIMLYYAECCPEKLEAMRKNA